MPRPTASPQPDASPLRAVRPEPLDGPASWPRRKAATSPKSLSERRFPTRSKARLAQNIAVGVAEQRGGER